MSDTLAQAALTLDALLALWPRLVESVTPGTRRRWVERQQDLDETGQRVPEPTETRCPDCRSVRLRQPDQVIAATDAVLPGRPYCPLGCDDAPNRPGYSRSPAADDALSVMVSVAADLTWLEDEVRKQLGFIALDEHHEVQAAHRLRQSLPRLAGRDAVAAATWLRSALPSLTDHADLARHAERELARMRRAVSRALGDSEAVHPIKAPCPICSCMSLRSFPERELIICIHEKCRCTEADCRCSIDSRYRHRWPRDRWPWLARVLGVDLEQGERAG